MKSFNKGLIFTSIATTMALGLSACTEEKGALEIKANGEDFVRQGFVSKDGWNISFDNLYVTLNNINAYKTDNIFDESSGKMPVGESVAIKSSKTLDLAAGDATAEPILVEKLVATSGQYNAISWEMINGDNGYTLQLIGKAVNQEAEIPFDIKIKETYRYACGEYVGDERKGFVKPNETGEVEMTFHFDHVFGDAGSDASEPLNIGALGFNPLAALAKDGKLDITQAQLKSQLSDKNYATLMDTLATLGHVGEGHCYEAKNGHTSHE